MKRFDTASKDEALKEIIKPLTRKPAKRSLAEQLAEIPEAELRAFLKAYNKKKK
jgi:Arc/MetJ family transcription regulator